MLTHRTNVLLDDHSKAVLDFLMEKKKKTAAGVFRDYLREEGKRYKIKIVKKRTRAEVLDDIIRLRKYINTKGINYRELIDDGRKY